MKIKNESGAIVLEATYCILISIIVLMLMMSYGFFLYQKTMVTIVANEVAEEIAQTYKLKNVSDSSMLTSSDISGIGKYRYFFFESRFQSKNEAKAYSFVDMRLSKTALAEKKGNLRIDIETIIDDIGRRHYKVTIKQKYEFLMGKMLNIIGQEDVQELEATAYVESVDVLNYINTVKFTKYGINKMKDNVKMLKVVDSVISLLHSIFDD